MTVKTDYENMFFYIFFDVFQREQQKISLWHDYKNIGI